METGVLSGMQLAAAFPEVVLENFYRKSLHSIEAGKHDAPYGYVIPADQTDPTRIAFVVNVLRLQGIEVGRATTQTSNSKKVRSRKNLLSSSAINLTALGEDPAREAELIPIPLSAPMMTRPGPWD